MVHLIENGMISLLTLGTNFDIHYSLPQDIIGLYKEEIITSTSCNTQLVIYNSVV